MNLSSRSNYRCLLLSTIVALALTGCSLPATSTTPSTAGGATASAGQVGLITEPAAGIAPIVDFIRGAHRSVDVVMYEFQDTKLMHDLAADAGRGVHVRVLLNGGYYGEGSPQNQTAYRYLTEHGASVRWTPRYFALTHQKTVIVDHDAAYILTFNFTSQYYATSRDFGIRDENAADVNAAESTFDADWNDQKITAQDGTDLIWSPKATAASVALIASAKHTLDIYNEEMDSKTIETALENAARRGVNVRVVMTASSDWDDAFTALKNAGVSVHTFAASASLYIHAKMILVDSNVVFLGSQNFSSTSLSRNRELGLRLTARPIIASLSKTFDADYAASSAF